VTHWLKVDNAIITKPTAIDFKRLQFISRQFADELASKFGIGGQVCSAANSLLGAPAHARNPDESDQGEQ
jgi:hypothetical protein